MDLNGKIGDKFKNRKLKMILSMLSQELRAIALLLVWYQHFEKQKDVAESENLRLQKKLRKIIDFLKGKKFDYRIGNSPEQRKSETEFIFKIHFMTNQDTNEFFINHTELKHFIDFKILTEQQKIDLFQYAENIIFSFINEISIYIDENKKLDINDLVFDDF
jgi:hypothetical protein